MYQEQRGLVNCLELGQERRMPAFVKLGFEELNAPQHLTSNPFTPASDFYGLGDAGGGVARRG